MRPALLLALALLAACAQNDAATANVQPLWRMDVSRLESDRALVRECLMSDDPGACTRRVQAVCLSETPGAAMAPGAAARRCDWRAIAAWEDEMADVLARLRAALGADLRDQLDASQRAWERALRADVGLRMDMYERGAMAGPAGADTRARATAARVLFLNALLLEREF